MITRIEDQRQQSTSHSFFKRTKHHRRIQTTAAPLALADELKIRQSFDIARRLTWRRLWRRRDSISQKTRFVQSFDEGLECRNPGKRPTSCCCCNDPFEIACPIGMRQQPPFSNPQTVCEPRLLVMKNPYVFISSLMTTRANVFGKARTLGQRSAGHASIRFE